MTQLAGNAERLAAGGDQPQVRHRCDQRVGQGRRLIDDVLTVIEDHDEGAAGEVEHEVIHRRFGSCAARNRRPARSQCRRRGRGDPFGIGDPGELD